MNKKLFLILVLSLFLLGCEKSLNELTYGTGSEIVKYNIHEHIESLREAPVLLEAMDKAGMRTAFLEPRRSDNNVKGTVARVISALGRAAALSALAAVHPFSRR